MRVVKTIQSANIEVTCDICNKRGITSCWLCEKDICLDCSEIWFQDNYDDYPRRLCHSCNATTSPYIRDLELLLENYEKSVEEILTVMRNSVKV